MENDHLIEFHLTFSVDRKFLIILAFDRINFWRLIQIFNNESLIFYHLIEFFETFQLIKSSNNGILSFRKDSINCLNPSVLFSQLIKTFINVILRYLEVSINWVNPSVLIWQLIESFLKL
jgi:hypothetical protein